MPKVHVGLRKSYGHMHGGASPSLGISRNPTLTPHSKVSGEVSCDRQLCRHLARESSALNCRRK